MISIDFDDFSIYSLVFVSIDKIYQTLDSDSSNFVKNSPLHVIFSTLFSLFGYPNETLSLICLIYYVKA